MEICFWVEARSVILLKIIHQQNSEEKKKDYYWFIILTFSGEKKKNKSLESSFKVDDAFAEGILNSGKQNKDQSF